MVIEYMPMGHLRMYIEVEQTREPPKQMFAEAVPV